MEDATTLPADDLNDALAQALLHIRRRKFEEAEASLSRVLATAPDDPKALQLFGVLRRAQGQFAQAEDFYRRSLAAELEQPHVHHDLGNLLRTLNRFDESISEQREAIHLKPNYAEAHLGLAFALSAKGDHIAAEKSCRDVLRLQPNSLPAKLTLATELCKLGRPTEAESLLRGAISVGIRDPVHAAAFAHNLGLALQQQQKFSEALDLFDAAQSRVPNLPSVDYSRGFTLELLGRLDEAADCYRKALARESDDLEALARLALISTRLGDFATSQDCAARALALDPDHPIALVVFAILEIEAGRFDSGKQALTCALDNCVVAGDRESAFAAGFAADAFDRHDRILEAFAGWRDSNEIQRVLLAAQFERGRAIDDVARLTRHFEHSCPWPAGDQPRGSEDAPAGHVFVLGFMRSGTTLLEAILATNPNVVRFDEIEFLAEPARIFLLNQTGLGRLQSLEAAEVAKWRDFYWKSVQSAGFSVAGKTVVDKMAFHTLRLPLILRLFPSAKVIFAIRDPRDVVLSCFRRRFSPTPYSNEFFRLDDCARFYADTMTLAELYRRRLPLNVHECRHEDVIAAFEPSLRAVCDFIGIEWNDRMRDFRASAETFDPRSASAAQVRRGLYAEAAGQWRRYRNQLAPILPILAPWVARFGYPAD